MSKQKKTRDYGDDPHVADFPDLTINDIKMCTREVELTVGQKKIKKTTPTSIRR